MAYFQKISIWVNFGGSFNGRCWYFIWLFGLFFGYLVPMVVWYIFSRFYILYQEKSGNPEQELLAESVNFFLFVQEKV
jgi:hypothetical protein